MQQEFLKDIITRLEKTGVTYAITGSIASNLWGAPRTTHDVDIVVILSISDIDGLLTVFSDSYYVSEPAIRKAILQKSMFNVIDPKRNLKADFWVSGDDPFNESMLRRRCRLEIVPGQEAYVGSAEDVLLHKLVWNQITPSARQLSDAAGIVAVQGEKLDLAYLRQWTTVQGTAQVLEEILQGKHLKQS